MEEPARPASNSGRSWAIEPTCSARLDAEFRKASQPVPAVPIDQLRAQLREDLGDEPEPVSSQIDKLGGRRLDHAGPPRDARDGSEVVVKIHDPGVAERSKPTCDCSNTSPSSRVGIPGPGPYGPVDLVRAFARSLRNELEPRRPMPLRRAGRGHRVNPPVRRNPAGALRLHQ